MRQLIYLMLTFLLVGCATSEANNTSQTRSSRLIDATTETQQIDTADAGSLNFSIENVDIRIQHPKDWEYHTTDYGVVLIESIDTVATEGMLSGLITHVFIPPLGDLSLNAAEGRSTALQMLEDITRTEDLMNNAATTQPTPLMWSGLDAAYFLMNNGEGSVTLVIGLTPPEDRHLITVQISAPLDDADRIRENLPRLMQNLSVNDILLDHTELESLPEPLVFPTFQTD